MCGILQEINYNYKQATKSCSRCLQQDCLDNMVASVDIVVLSDTVHQRELDHQVKIIKETATQHFCS